MKAASKRSPSSFTAYRGSDFVDVSSEEEYSDDVEPEQNKDYYSSSAQKKQGIPSSIKKQLLRDIEESGGRFKSNLDFILKNKSDVYGSDAGTLVFGIELLIRESPTRNTIRFSVPFALLEAGGFANGNVHAGRLSGTSGLSSYP